MTAAFDTRILNPRPFHERDSFLSSKHLHVLFPAGNAFLENSSFPLETQLTCILLCGACPDPVLSPRKKWRVIPPLLHLTTLPDTGNYMATLSFSRVCLLYEVFMASKLKRTRLALFSWRPARYLTHGRLTSVRWMDGRKKWCIESLIQHDLNVDRPAFLSRDLYCI